MTRYKFAQGSLNEHNIAFDIALGHNHDGVNSRLITPWQYTTGWIDAAYDPSTVANTGSTFTLCKTLHYYPTGSGLHSFYANGTGSSQGDYGFKVQGSIARVRVSGSYGMVNYQAITGGLYLVMENDTIVSGSQSTFQLVKTLPIGTVAVGLRAVQCYAEFEEIFGQPVPGGVNFIGQWEVFIDNNLQWSGSINSSTWTGSTLGPPVDVTLSHTSTITLYLQGALMKLVCSNDLYLFPNMQWPSGSIPINQIYHDDYIEGYVPYSYLGLNDPSAVTYYEQPLNRTFQVWCSSPSGSSPANTAGGLRVYINGAFTYQSMTTGSAMIPYDTGWINVLDPNNYPNGMGDIQLYLSGAQESGSHVQIKLGVESIGESY